MGDDGRRPGGRSERLGEGEGKRWEGDTAQQSTHLFLQTQRVKAALIFYTRVNGRRPGIFSEAGGAPYSLRLRGQLLGVGRKAEGSGGYKEGGEGGCDGRGARGPSGIGVTLLRGETTS